MPICTFCGQEKGGYWYTRPDGSRGFSCTDEPCHTKGGEERTKRARLDREAAHAQADARHGQPRLL